MSESDEILIFDEVLPRRAQKATAFETLKNMKQRGHHSKVIRECIKALSMYPDDMLVRYLLAESYFETGFFGQAEAELERIISELNNLRSVFKLQAKVEIRRRNYEEARQALNRYLAFNPDDQEALDLLAGMETPEKEESPEEPIPPEDDLDSEEGVEVFEELATPTLAEIYFVQGKICEAITTYEKFISKTPGDRSAVQRLSELKALTAEKTAGAHRGERDQRKGKEKMIRILSGWLARIKESSIAG
jgi:tetratricopeptide (TPR) repeat protein